MELVNNHLQEANLEREQNGVDVIDTAPQMLNSIQNSLSQVLLWMRLLIVSIVAVFIIFGIIYNFFSKPENDIPVEIFNKFYEILGPDTSSLLPLQAHYLLPEVARNSTNKIF